MEHTGYLTTDTTDITDQNSTVTPSSVSSVFATANLAGGGQSVVLLSSVCVPYLDRLARIHMTSEHSFWL